MGGNRDKRQEEKRERDQAKKGQAQTEAQKKQDAEWTDDDKNLQKKMARKAAADAKRDDALKKKEELKLLEKTEEEALAQAKKAKQHVPKLTRTQIQQQAEAKAALERAQATGSDNGVVHEQPLVENMNRLTDEFDVYGVGLDESLAALEGKGPGERHPERRAKAAWNEFFERRLAEEKKERPGLRISQYREILWKEWQKSPENPFNQDTLSYNASKGMGAPAALSSDLPPSSASSPAAGSVALLNDTQLEEITKKELVELLQAVAPPDFLAEHQIGGASKNVVKRKRQDELIRAYKAFYKL